MVDRYRRELMKKLGERLKLLKLNAVIFLGMSKLWDSVDFRSRHGEKRDEKKIEDFDRWFEKVYPSLHGRYCDYLSVLRDLGGIALTSEIVKLLGYHKSTVSLIEKDLCQMGIIGFKRCGKKKIVYLNHPSIACNKDRMFKELFDKTFR